MKEVVYDGSLEGLFAVLDEARRTGNAPGRILRAPPGQPYSPEQPYPPARPDKSGLSGQACGAVQGDLFDDAGTLPAGAAGPVPGFRPAPRAVPAGAGVEACPAPSGEAAPVLFEVSVNAFDAFVRAWMSEFPIEAAIVRYACKVLSAAEAAARTAGQTGALFTEGSPSRAVSEAARRGAEKAAADRGDGDALTVLEASYKVGYEIDKLRGLLRFTPDEHGVYTARCSPDHFVLPALGEHFCLRFGGTPWIIIDEKRGLSVFCFPGEAPRMRSVSSGSPRPELSDGWEGLWRHYHKIINNESRNNPALQRRFMPRRYWKYLPEMN
ncbi:MAG: TIGR03915 family putative DNA repair protein [Treponema sp.]|nr:TIGR03915 family putative DNA repair protein [Treponema sp.]